MAKTKDKIECEDKEHDNERIFRLLGKNLRKIRQKRAKESRLNDDCGSLGGGGAGCFSYERVAHLTGLHQNSIRNYEQGKNGMTVANLVRLKHALGCDWNDLLDGLDSELVEERMRCGAARAGKR